MFDVIYARINLFRPDVEFSFNDVIIAEVPIDQINDVIPSLCSLYKTNKVKLFGNSNYINGLLMPTLYNDIEIEVINI